MSCQKFSREYLHLVSSVRRGKYSLSHMDGSRLFYPSKEEAKAAARDNVPGGLGIITGMLPEPSIHYDDSPRDDAVFFALFGNSNIVCSDSVGTTALYNTEAHSFHGLPKLRSPKGPRRITVCIPRTEADVRCDFESLRSTPMWSRVSSLRVRAVSWLMRAARHGDNHKYSLYVMDMDPAYNPGCCCFEVLVYYSIRRRRWRQLPMPAFFGGPRYWARDNMPFAVVDGGTKICVSLSSESDTYCFDTVAMEWKKAGDRVLPFRGRAEHVPELGLWVGLSAQKPYNLYSVDLSGVTMGTCDTQPVAMDVVGKGFDDLPLSEDWSLKNAALVNMGSGRFCVARFFDRHSHGDQENHNQVVILTGVELHHPDDGRGEEGVLGITKHKSECLASDSILCVL